jgi:uncharacterized protein YjdB
MSLDCNPEFRTQADIDAAKGSAAQEAAQNRTVAEQASGDTVKKDVEPVALAAEAHAKTPAAKAPTEPAQIRARSRFANTETPAAKPSAPRKNAPQTKQTQAKQTEKTGSPAAAGSAAAVRTAQPPGKTPLRETKGIGETAGELARRIGWKKEWTKPTAIAAMVLLVIIVLAANVNDNGRADIPDIPAAGTNAETVSELGNSVGQDEENPAKQFENIIEMQIGSPLMNINGALVQIDENNSSPAIVNGSTMLPIRGLIEAMGGTVSWDGKTKTVSIREGTHIIDLTVGSNKAYVDGIPWTLETAPMILDGKTMVPVRFVAESLEKNVAWDSKTKTVTIRYIANSYLRPANTVASAEIAEPPLTDESADDKPAEPAASQTGSQAGNVQQTPAPVKVTGVSLKGQTVGVGERFTVSPTITPANAANKNVTWNSNDTSVIVIDQNGSAVAKKEGSATITVITKDGEYFASATFTVKTNVIAVTYVELSPSSLIMEPGETYNVAATVSPSNATNKTVIWVSSNESAASVSGGRVTAWKAGTARISATSADGTHSASLTVTVTAKQVVAVTSVTVTPVSWSLGIGESYTLSVSVLPSDAASKSVAWSSSDSSVATVSAAGLVSAQKAGTARITAIAQDGSGKSGYMTLTVIGNVAVTSVTVTPASYSLNIGGSYRPSVSVLPSDAANKNVTWSSSDSSVATVSTAGLVTAQKAGTARIAATAQDGSGKSDYMVITVNANVAVTGVEIWPGSISMVIGESYTLRASVQPSNATNTGVSWKTSNSTVATVSGGTVTAKSAGTATITVTTSDGSKTASVLITVLPAETVVSPSAIL